MTETESVNLTPEDGDAPALEPQLLAGVFVMPNGQLTTSAAPGVDIEILFLTALTGLAEKRAEERARKNPKNKILRAGGPLPPFPQELTR